MAHATAVGDPPSREWLDKAVRFVGRQLDRHGSFTVGTPFPQRHERWRLHHVEVPALLAALNEGGRRVECEVVDEDGHARYLLRAWDRPAGGST